MDVPDLHTYVHYIYMSSGWGHNKTTYLQSYLDTRKDENNQLSYDS
jgi:hypothetical protein